MGLPVTENSETSLFCVATKVHITHMQQFCAQCRPITDLRPHGSRSLLLFVTAEGKLFSKVGGDGESHALTCMTEMVSIQL